MVYSKMKGIKANRRHRCLWYVGGRDAAQEHFFKYA